MGENKRERLELPGVVIKSHGNSTFTVNVSEGHDVLCTLSGKIRQNAIRILDSDQVLIEVSIYDLKKGRIVFRNKG